MNQSDLNTLLADTSALPRSTIILRENGLRCLVLHLKAGEELREHSAPGAISVHCLRGEVRFSAGEDKLDLRAGVLITLTAGAPHAVVAQEESVLLVTMSEPVQA